MSTDQELKDLVRERDLNLDEPEECYELNQRIYEALKEIPESRKKNHENITLIFDNAGRIMLSVYRDEESSDCFATVRDLLDVLFFLSDDDDKLLLQLRWLVKNVRNDEKKDPDYDPQFNYTRIQELIDGEIKRIHYRKHREEIERMKQEIQNRSETTRPLTRAEVRMKKIQEQQEIERLEGGN